MRSGYLLQSMYTSVMGYLLKYAPSQDLINTIQKGHNGGVVDGKRSVVG